MGILSPSSGVEGSPAGAAGTPSGVHLALLAVQLSFSGFHVVGKVVLTAVDPLALACLRVLFAVPFLFLAAQLQGELRSIRGLAGRLALLGLLGVFLNQILFVTGLALTTATNAAILMPSIPVFAVAVGAALGLERIGPRRALGIALAVAGALVLLDPTRFSLEAGTLLGNLLILVNCLSFATFLVLQRPLLQRLGATTLLAWVFLIGGSGVLTCGLPRLLQLEPSRLGGDIWLGIAYILVFPTLLGYFLNAWAVRRSSSSLVATYTTLQPLVTALLSATFLGETLHARQLLGFLLVVAGLWSVSRRGAG